MTNGINIVVNEDDTLTIDWDENHPVWSIFNTMTKDEISEYINNLIKDYIDKYCQNEKNN